ncbi:uncharacterized protein LOC128258960 [Drosophila gunungcola]|uniref:Uncharacterized protein n=1 Tax=Drosophila gunungcola TaxID=103775 RepID=A0A9P9YLL4_9MUSC|nr:uncharacterized protein LOC128258960 [Drosophila gunungcola]XP_052846971.1 uncharacterized protein LOC128258960 [Drosophila gunungcola]KAI8039267.1 hypothetical protein M5D96_007990 [Drosophila gunungcola]
MDANGQFVLTEKCFLEIMNYVIVNCKKKEQCSWLSQAYHYDDLINLVLAHEPLLDLFKTHHKQLYEELVLALACGVTKLLIDLRVNKSSNRNELFFISHLKTIREENPFAVELYFGHRRDNHRDLAYVIIGIKGFTTDLKNFAKLMLNGNITEKVLEKICTLIPNLKKLNLDKIVPDGSLSSIVNHCGNLEVLRITLGPGCDVTQFASFAKLPNLKKFTIDKIQKSGSQLLFFNDLKRWHRPKSLRPLTLTTEDRIMDESQPITFATFDSLSYLEICELLDKRKMCNSPNSNLFFISKYDLNQELKDSCSVEESLVTIASNQVRIKFDRRDGELVIKLNEQSYISQLGSLSKLPNLSRLVIHQKCNTIAHFLQSMVPKGSFALKSIKMNYQTLDQSECIELAKIESVRFLECNFFKWHLMESLNQLTNLQHLRIEVRHDVIDSNTSRLIPKLLTVCQVQASIKCERFHIVFKKKEKKLEIYVGVNLDAELLTPLAQLSGVSTLKISAWPNFKSLNSLFEAFATCNFSAIEEINLKELEETDFEDISKMSEIQTIKKLTGSFSNLNGIEKLGNLNNLEDLNIFQDENIGIVFTKDSNINLTPLFLKLSEKNIIQKFALTKDFLPEEVANVSQIRSLRKLNCYFSEVKDTQSLSELANSHIEELTVNSLDRSDSLHILFAAFSSNSRTRLKHLKITDKTLNIAEMSEISKIHGLTKLDAGFCSSECAQMIVRLPNLEHLVIKSCYGGKIVNFENLLRDLVHKLPYTLQNLDLQFPIGFIECCYLSQLESLKSLKCILRSEPGLDVLAKIKNLQELIICETWHPVNELFRAFSLKTEPMLRELKTPIVCSAEIREISQIKSLTKLNIDFMMNTCDNLSDLSQLNELKSLSIVENGVELARIESNGLLPIFQSCQKLDCVTLKFSEYGAEAPNFVSEVNTILKSVRDPALQEPLTLTLHHESTFPRFHVEDIDDAYLNVSYSYETHGAEVKNGSDGEESEYSE